VKVDVESLLESVGGLTDDEKQFVQKRNVY